MKNLPHNEEAASHLGLDLVRNLLDYSRSGPWRLRLEQGGRGSYRLLTPYLGFQEELLRRSRRQTSPQLQRRMLRRLLLRIPAEVRPLWESAPPPRTEHQVLQNPSTAPEVSIWFVCCSKRILKK